MARISRASVAVVGLHMRRACSSIDKIRAELAWVNEAPDPITNAGAVRHACWCGNGMVPA